MVQRFEEFVDNTLEEDCVHQCPRGRLLQVSWTQHSILAFLDMKLI